MARYDVSAGRKALYYGGMVLAGIGILLFLSVFVTVISEMNRPFGARLFGPSPMATAFGRAFAGVLMVAAGNALRIVGARGLAGSGIILDPRKARKDLEPWSRMAGGMVGDALSEVEVLQHAAARKEAPAVVKVRCRQCGSLNDEEDKYCGQCGAKM